VVLASRNDHLASEIGISCSLYIMRPVFISITC